MPKENELNRQMKFYYMTFMDGGVSNARNVMHCTSMTSKFEFWFSSKFGFYMPTCHEMLMLRWNGLFGPRLRRKTIYLIAPGAKHHLLKRHQNECINSINTGLFSFSITWHLVLQHTDCTQAVSVAYLSGFHALKFETFCSLKVH